LSRTLRELRRQREELHIDPARLMVLELTLLETAQEELIERFGVHVVQEQETRQQHAQVCYTVRVRFRSGRTLAAFLRAQQARSRRALNALVERLRASSGEPHATDVLLCFVDQDEAKAFITNKKLHTTLGLTVRTRRPVRREWQAIHRLLVQFPDQATLERFAAELRHYQQEDTRGHLLTRNQRRAVFDALQKVGKISPEDKKGRLLRERGHPPDQAVFYVDVDLWHPGSPDAAGMVRSEFTTVVENAGGVVTDQPTTVADSLLLARVKGSVRTLDALLSYEQVARVDLPPKPPEWSCTIFDEVEPPPLPVGFQPDAPLACVVDSGIVAGHPLLAGVVMDERDFDSGEGNAVDNVGHGTHVGGIVVYGDIRRCLEANQWVPKVRLLSAKVMKRVEARSSGGHVWAVQAGFADEKRVETQLREAITSFATEYGCRVFNLSLGTDTTVHDQPRQLPWACLLDSLARELDIVIVVSAGNVSIPEIPPARTTDEFQEKMRDRLAQPAHAIADPASAACALTVGAMARTDVSWAASQTPGQRPPLVGAPVNGPSPFTRTGVLDGTGSGVRRSAKPEVVAYGGNYCLAVGGSSWNQTDPLLGEPSLRFNYQGRRLLSVACGTSVAAPYVTHTCALVSAELQRISETGTAPSANLVRALAVHSADLPPDALRWLESSGGTPAEAERLRLRLTGFGIPDPVRATRSTDNRAVLVAEDRLGENRVHMYALDLPDEFLTRSGSKKIQVALAYDPPVRATRKDYLARTMWFRLYRGLATRSIVDAVSKAQGSGAQPKIAAKYIAKSRPPCTLLQWSTVQSAVFEAQQQRALDYRVGPGGPCRWHVVVGCVGRFGVNDDGIQRYALVVSLEHSDEQVRLYQEVRQRISAVRARLRR